MRGVIRPFLDAPGDTVRLATPWHLRTATGREPLGESVSTWDPFTTLHLDAQLDVDAAAIAEHIHLGPRGTLAVVVSAHATATKQRGPVCIRPLTRADAQTVDLEVVLEGGELGGSLELVTTVVVAEPDPLDKLSPDRPGSSLWESRVRTRLEGTGSRFPTEAADLGAKPYRMPRAGWTLQLLSDDLDSPAVSAFRLIVNTAHPLIRKVLANEQSPEAVGCLRTMRWDVARTLIDFAFEHPDFTDRGEREGFEPDSLGSVLDGLIHECFQDFGTGPGPIRQLRELDRARYLAMIQQSFPPLP